MVYSFQNTDAFLFSIEKEIIDVLFEYKLLSKLDRSAKKIIFYYFVKNFGEEINKNKDLLFFHDHCFSESHELFTYYDREKLTNFLNKIISKLKKVTNKLFFLKKKTILPKEAPINELEGCVVDEVLLLSIKNPIDPKKLKEFLDEHNLTDMFASIARKVY